MTLPKQTLFVLPFILSASYISWSPKTKPGSLSITHYAASPADSSLPYFPKLIVPGLNNAKAFTSLSAIAPQISLNTRAASFVQAYLKKNRKDLEALTGAAKSSFPKWNLY
jgi:hypothetical protein